LTLVEDAARRPVAWREVSIEKDGVTFHGLYFTGVWQIIVLYGGHLKSIQHADAPSDVLARRILRELVATGPRTH